MALSDVSELTGVNRHTLQSRIRNGIDEDKLIDGKERKKYEIKGTLYTADEIAKTFKIPKAQFHSRLGKGWSIERASTFPYEKSRPEKVIKYRGEEHTVKEWSKITGIKMQTIYWRLYQGWEAEKILSI